MKYVMCLPLGQNLLTDYDSWDDLRRSLAALGCTGVEGIWPGGPGPEDIPRDLIVSYHLTFYPDWLDFYREDKAALRRKFGSLDTAYQFYGGSGPDTLLELYRADLNRARRLNARYMVFHVSDVSLEEGYTYRWLHSDEEVIDAAVELINLLLRDCAPDFTFLVENQWWPGFTFTDPKKTERLLNGIRFARKGILLDTGHLMNTCLDLRTQEEGVQYIHRMLDCHGSLSDFVRGIHLHQSISGAYVRSHTGRPPDSKGKDYLTRFNENYRHILQIDRHLPWTAPGICSVLERIAPDYVAHELSARTRRQREAAIRTQRETLQKGGRCV
ncbi:TIM barrel protein [uncultured Pseudoflavonifractor sp.]|uniref:TIM barrel protein n=1 Tax=uncultured Pseudoflavonifractor sp. TaxID=1221379 RepID=UPI0025E0F0A6|nr:TIM barrel protein [uncultured Pseudoflavonifractor sp.]